ncbi:MAG TPA: glutamate racemase [Anaerolineales bacterium]|nr:glutamate racemase [Anaerolineales bacterium]
MTPSDRPPIGVFDSGVGGLSILRELRRQMPGEDFVYFADQSHVPYGPRPMDEVRAFSEAVVRFLIGHGADLIVVACNTASAAALRSLRATFPGLPFVGMEPAVKPAVEVTRSGVVGVLATPATFQGELYASVVERFAQGVRLVNETVPGLVEEIEAGRLDGPRTEELIRRALAPIREAGADTIVLACTHYPFVIPVISRLAGPGVAVIDPAPAIARQAARLRGGGAREGGGSLRLITSGSPDALARLAQELIGESAAAERAVWQEGTLFLPTPG